MVRLLQEFLYNWPRYNATIRYVYTYTHAYVYMGWLYITRTRRVLREHIPLASRNVLASTTVLIANETCRINPGPTFTKKAGVSSQDLSDAQTHFSHLHTVFFLKGKMHLFRFSNDVKLVADIPFCAKRPVNPSYIINTMTAGGLVIQLMDQGYQAIIGLDNGLLFGQHQAIIWPNAGIALIRPLKQILVKI